LQEDAVSHPIEKPALKILLIEDVAADARLINYELEKADILFDSRCVATKESFLSQIKRFNPDAIISDFSMPQFNALDALQALKDRNLDIPFILVTGSQSEEVAVECIKEGADDYILKSSLKRLPSALLSSLNRKKAEKGQREAEDRMREQAALLNKAQDAIFVIDLEGNVTFWNPSAERVYGWSAAELVGKQNALTLYPTSENHKLSEAMHQAVKEGDWDGELAQATKDGREITVESRWSLVRDAEGRPKSFLIINSDITEKKKLQTHFLRAQRMESIGTLAGGIAHDLNNALTPILVSIRMLKEFPGVPMDVLETLETSAERGASIVQQVLSFARGSEGERTLIQVKHPLNEVIKIAKDIFPRTITIKARLENDLWPVFGDPTELHQVFMNLFLNARDAMPHGGKLEVLTSNTVIDENYARMQADAKAGPFVVISVSDTGTGIPPALVNKIFEPFFTTKELGKGTGLGLSTAIGIVKSHGGFLTVYSEVGKGTSFKVYLPAEQSSIEKAAEPARRNPPRGRGELIMIVDDEAAVREIIKLTLENNGYRVLTANDGAEAVAVFASHQNQIDCVIVDAMMPYMDGPSTVRAIQKLAPDTPFITISGLAENDKVSDMIEIAHAMFLAKPFTSEQILTALDQALRQPKSRSQHRLHGTRRSPRQVQAKN
jgi:two-component system cell cycle sensor histidine kinase/response regulator CckA